MSNEAKTIRVAIFKRLGDYSWETVSEESLEASSDYIRLSEYVAVEFPPLETAIQIQHHLDAIDREEQKVRAELGKKIEEFKSMRAQLLALPHIEAAP